MKLDLKDRKILYELDKNARLPASKIAKRVGLSIDSVNYRIKQFYKNNIIFKFMTMMNTEKLGLTAYKVLYRFQNTTLKKEEEILKFFTMHPNTQYVTTTEGLYDINMNILAPNASDLNEILSKIDTKYGEFFAERQVNIIVRAEFFLRDYLVNKKSDELRKPVFFGSEPIYTKTDEKDRRILSILAKNARLSAVEIGENVKMSSDAVIKRIKRLEEYGIIQNYAIYPNSSAIGYKSYFILFKFRDLSAEQERRFLTYCRLHPNVWFYAKLIGQWDCVIDLETESDEEFRRILMNIKRDFSGILREYNIFRFTRTHKFDQYPMNS